MSFFQKFSSKPSPLWTHALRAILRQKSIKHALFLGIDNRFIQEICHRFPKATCTAFSKDPNNPPFSFKHPERVQVMHGNLREHLAQIPKTFDIIFLNLLPGSSQKKELFSKEGVQMIRELLGYDGSLVCALERQKEADLFSQSLSLLRCWQKEDHTLLLLQPHGLGVLGDPPPQGFTHPMQSPTFLQGTMYKASKHVSIIGTRGSLGVRQQLGPYALDIFTTDTEPTIEAWKGVRFVIWQPITKVTRPKGWMWWPVRAGMQQHAVAEITETKTYWKSWNEQQQRHRKKWLKQNDLHIEPISFAEFRDAYNTSGKLPKHRASSIEAIRRRMEHRSHGVLILGARDKITKRIVAGLAVCHLKDISASEHLAAFIHPDFEKTSVGTGLIDAWYQSCITEGIRFPYFGIVWSKGDPKEWKGYTQFKRQFHPYFIRSPLPFVKFTLH